MRSEAVLPLVASLVALEFTTSLFRRWLATRRPYLRSWTISLACFTAGCAALWYGTAFGWTDATLRTYYVGGAFLAVPWLAVGELEILLRPVPGRIVAFFTLLLTLNGALVLAVTPFVDDRSVSGLALPDGADFFPVPARVAVVLANSLGTVVVVGGTLWSAIRLRRGGPGARQRLAGLLLVVIGVLFAASSGALTFLGEVETVALGLGAGAAIMYAGFVVASRPAREPRVLEAREAECDRGATPVIRRT